LEARDTAGLETGATTELDPIISSLPLEPCPVIITPCPLQNNLQ